MKNNKSAAANRAIALGGGKSLKRRLQDNWQLLKALGDSTRLKIMHNLVESPSYLQELAKKLKLTPATVLHHLGILMSEGLIEIQMTGEKKRVYYQVNKQGLQEVSNGIMQLAMTRQERETQKREQQMKDMQKNQGDGQWTI